MRIVLDTNVVFSALLWRGPPYRLMQMVRDRHDGQLIASVPLIDELADVLGRAHARGRHNTLGRTAGQLLGDYLEVVELVEPADITPRSVDPDDDEVLATALAAGADLIVSGDPDRLNLKHFHGIDIVTVSEAIARMSTAQRN